MDRSFLSKYICLTTCVVLLLTLQVAADKEPHENSKEDQVLSNKVSIFSYINNLEFQGKHGQSEGPRVASPTIPGNELGFTHAFIASFSVIVVSELGDKTFFIAAIMAMRHPRVIVFTGAILALVIMTIISGIVLVLKLLNN